MKRHNYISVAVFSSVTDLLKMKRQLKKVDNRTERNKESLLHVNGEVLPPSTKTSKDTDQTHIIILYY